jgi:hypothetical protein
MTHDSGFHMKDKNWRKAFSDFSSSCNTWVSGGKDFIAFKGAYLVGTEDAKSSLSFGVSETVFITLQQCEDVGHRYMLDIYLVLVVEV